MKFSGRPFTFFMLLASSSAAPQRQLYSTLVQQTDPMGALYRRDPLPKDNGNGNGNGNANGNGNGNGNSKDTTTTENAATPTEITTTAGAKNPDSTPTAIETIPGPTNGPIAAVNPSPSRAVSSPAPLSTSSLNTPIPLSASISSSTSVAAVVTPTPGMTIVVNNVETSPSTFESPDSSPDPSSSLDTPSPKHNAAGTITGVMVGLVIVLVLAVIGFCIWRKAQKKKAEDEEWGTTTQEKQSEKTLPADDVALAPPPAAYTATLPSQVLRTYKGQSFRSSSTLSCHQMDIADEPDEIMYMPAVAPQESFRGFDIAIPSPTLAVLASSPHTVDPGLLSPGLGEPRTRKQLTSFGSYGSGDPFSVNPPIDSPTSSVFGPGQAGIGVRFNIPTNNEAMPNGDNEMNQAKRWPQVDRRDTIYSQQAEEAYAYAI